MKVREVDPQQAHERLKEGETLFVDVRDPQSHAVARIPGSVHLGNASVSQFLAETPREKPLIIYCYHGNSSRDAAAFLEEQGFTDVASMAGGFEFWRQRFPEDTSSE